MNKVFLAVNGFEYTYDKLLNDLNLKTTYCNIIYIEENDPYIIFLSIIHSLLYGYPIELIDGDFSAKEIEELGIEAPSLTTHHAIEKPITINDMSSLLYKLVDDEQWTLSLYTSGTTGRPKKVAHTLKTLTRNVKSSSRYNNDIWALAYNPTHMAGIQVFVQAFLNQNTLIYTFDGQQRNLIPLMEKYKITHISATSSYYRNILPYLKNHIFDCMMRVTFGGEKYDSSLENSLRAIFPKARLRNIYASTEAGSLFTANGDIFEIPDTLQKLVRINENQELLIHHTILAESLLFSQNDEWFLTGDLVERLSQNQFRFVSRQSELINVGGYKVNPIEVESVLINVPGIVDLVVKSRENKVTGQILIADVVKDSHLNDKELKISIKQFASSHLQHWKIPRLIYFVDDIPKTRTGKKVRK